MRADEHDPPHLQWRLGLERRITQLRDLVELRARLERHAELRPAWVRIVAGAGTVALEGPIEPVAVGPLEGACGGEPQHARLAASIIAHKLNKRLVEAGREMR